MIREGDIKASSRPKAIVEIFQRQSAVGTIHIYGPTMYTFTHGMFVVGN